MDDADQIRELIDGLSARLAKLEALALAPPSFVQQPTNYLTPAHEPDYPAPAGGGPPTYPTRQWPPMPRTVPDGTLSPVTLRDHSMDYAPGFKHQDPTNR